MSMLKYRAWIRWAALPLAAGVAAFFAAPEPEAGRRTADLPDTFALPAELQRDDAEKLSAALKTRNLWGVVTPAAEKTVLVDPPWRLAGASIIGSEKIVVMEREGSPSQILRVGDMLPGKVKILDIKEDKLCILIEGKKRLLPILK